MADGGEGFVGCVELERRPRHRCAPTRLHSDNVLLSGDLAARLWQQGTGHVRGAPNHPQTQGTLREGQTDSPQGRNKASAR